MGGDLGPSIIVEAVLNFLRKHPDVEMTVCGKKEELSHLEGVCQIIDARDVMKMDAGALDAVHANESSMIKAINLMNDGFDGVISCGSTGAFFSSCSLIMKNLQGVSRAALVVSLPTCIKGKYVTVLDIGANNENSTEELVQFAKMGYIYAKYALGIVNPSIYLLNNGVESSKGPSNIRNAFNLLKDSDLPFKGNIEARAVFTGVADVVVADGFSGNVLLKTLEGTVGLVESLAIEKGFKDKFNSIKEVVDYKNTGGAMLLGINGVAVKAHGNADARIFESALNVAYNAIKNNFINKIKEALLHE